jgi:hypothetical protein
MRERLQRRKKQAGEKQESQAAPAPLQPAYFEAEEPEASSEAVESAAGERNSSLLLRLRNLPQSNLSSPARRPRQEAGSVRAHAAVAVAGDEEAAASRLLQRHLRPRAFPACPPKSPGAPGPKRPNDSAQLPLNQLRPKINPHLRHNRPLLLLPCRAHRREHRRELSCSPSGCRVPARAPGLSGITSPRFRLIWCGRFCSMMSGSSASRI